MIHFSICYHSDFEQDTQTSPGSIIPLCCGVCLVVWGFFSILFLFVFFSVVGFGALWGF